MSKIRVVCIGAGYFARFHVEGWQRIPEVELVAICDKDISKAQSLASEFAVPEVYGSIEQLCSDQTFDVVDIITPPNTHLELCDVFAKKGKHIICQKPLAPTLDEAKNVLRIAEESDIRFMVHENFRFQPWYRKMKELIQQGCIGDKLHTINLKMRMGDGWGDDAYLSRQPYFQTMPRLLIHETGIHYIDVFRFLIGEISSVYARLRKLNPVIAGEDCGLILFDFENGGQGILDGNRYNESNHENPRYTFGTTVIEGNAGTIRLYSDGTITTQSLGKLEEEIDYNHIDHAFAGDCVYFTQQHFVDSFLNNTPFETNGADYLNNLLVQEAVYESSEKRVEIKLNCSSNHTLK